MSLVPVVQSLYYTSLNCKRASYHSFDVTKLVSLLGKAPTPVNAHFSYLQWHSASLSQSSHSSSSDEVVRYFRFDFSVDGHSVELTQLSLLVNDARFVTKDATVTRVMCKYLCCYWLQSNENRCWISEIGEFGENRATGERNDYAHGRCACFVAISVAKAAALVGTGLIDENCCLTSEQWMNVKKLTSVGQGNLCLIDLVYFVVQGRMLVLRQSYRVVFLDSHLERLIHHSCYCGGSCRSL